MFVRVTHENICESHTYRRRDKFIIIIITVFIIVVVIIISFNATRGRLLIATMQNCDSYGNIECRGKTVDTLARIHSY